MPFDYPVPDLIDNSLHLWSYEIPIAENASDEIYSCLSLEEIQKSKELHSQELFMKSISRYSLLRLILSEYLNCNPGKIIIMHDKMGKPYISGEKGPCFNLSHSGNRILLGVSRDTPLGVDLELIKNAPPIDAMAMRYFTIKEIDQLKKKSHKDRVNLFYKIWTGKEALLKGKGLGLTVDLKQIEVLSNETNGNWSIISCDFWPGFCASLATPLKNPIINVLSS